MGLRNWLKKMDEATKVQLPQIEVEDKVYEGYRFPKEATVVVAPGVNMRDRYWTWNVTVGTAKRNGRKGSKDQALAAAESAARELVQRKREREAHLAQEKIVL